MDGGDRLWLMGGNGGKLEKMVGVRDLTVAARKRVWGWEHRPAWSADGRFLCFTLAGSRRLNKPRPPSKPISIQRLIRLRSESKHLHEKRFLELYIRERRSMEEEGPAELRRLERVRRDNCAWTADHRVGLVDFSTRRVCLRADYWDQFAWRSGDRP